MSPLLLCDYRGMGSPVVRMTTIPASMKPKTGLLWFWLIFLILVPLFPLTNFAGHPRWEAIHWIPFQDFSLSRYMMVDIIGNIGWFMIFGYLLHRLMSKTSSFFQSIVKAVLITAGVSLSVEIFQLFCNSRCPSMTDVVCNTLGGSLGAYFSQQGYLTVFSTPTSATVIEDDAPIPVLQEV
jgi:glycopeptide antibiotics resistance protein